MSSSVPAPSLRFRRLLVIAVVICGCVIVLMSTSIDMSLSPDSYHYMNEALWVQQHGGISLEYTWWPPLFPLTLSLFDEMITAARWMNIVCYAATVALTMWIVYPRLTLRPLIGVGMALLLSPALQYVYQWVWSEPIYILLITAFFALIVDTRLWRRIVLLALVTILITLQRYAGLWFIPLGMLALYLNKTNWRRIAVYTVLAALPIGLWGVRNVTLGFAAFGERGLPYNSWTKSSTDTTLTIFFWMPTLLLLVLMCWRQRFRLPRTLVIISTVYVLFYCVFITWSAATTAMDSPNQRLLAPIYIPTIFVTMALVGFMTKRGRLERPPTSEATELLPR